MGILDQKVIIITGATSGIGAATAKLAARAGARLALAGRREDRGQKLAGEINAEGGEAVFFKTDVGIENEVKSLVERTVEKFGKLDGAFNNAGISGDTAPMAELSTEQFDITIKVNLYSIFWCLKYQILAMKKSGGGSIVNCSSTAGKRAATSMASYVTSKHGIIGLSKTAAVDHAVDGVRVNCVLPGPVDTEVWEGVAIGREMLQQKGNLTVLKRHGAPEEIARPVIFLLSDEASYITGTELLVDGGYKRA